MYDLQSNKPENQISWSNNQNSLYSVLLLNSTIDYLYF